MAHSNLLTDKYTCPEMHAVAKMANLTEFYQGFWQIWRNFAKAFDKNEFGKTGEFGKIWPSTYVQKCTQ